MTKKHFEALAFALTGAKPYPAKKDSDMDHQYAQCVYAVAAVCGMSNIRFDRARFLAACGVETK